MDTILHIQGSEGSPLTPLFLIHAISGLALPYLGLDSLTDNNNQTGEDRPVYGISSPIYGSNNYRLPSSLDDVAHQYIALIQTEVQAKGPYLLGGWSLGGMIALKMACILEAQGESVLHVIMIDSPNPENNPSFVDRAEHDKITSMTYDRVVNRISTPGLLSDGDSGSSSDSPDEDDDLGLTTLLPRIRKHVYNGVHMVSSVDRNHFLPDHCDVPITLVKCSLLRRLSSTLRKDRKEFLHQIFSDECMGWQSAKFEHFQTVQFRAQHDNAFDTGQVEELSGILRGILARVS